MDHLWGLLLHTTELAAYHASIPILCSHAFCFLGYVCSFFSIQLGWREELWKDKTQTKKERKWERVGGRGGGGGERDER